MNWPVSMPPTPGQDLNAALSRTPGQDLSAALSRTASSVAGWVRSNRSPCNNTIPQLLHFDLSQKAEKRCCWGGGCT